VAQLGAGIAAGASAVGVDLALYQRSLAEVHAPVAGVVVKVVSAGDVIAPGATVAEIRQPGRARVSAWLAPSKLPRVSVGDTAWIGADWLEKPVRGRVTSIGQKAEYPPTSSATKDVHLTRAVKIEITADAGHAALPPGTPVDISIVPSSKR
jgi:multidrug resistance efflux pump